MKRLGTVIAAAALLVAACKDKSGNTPPKEGTAAPPADASATPVVGGSGSVVPPPAEAPAPAEDTVRVKFAPPVVGQVVENRESMHREAKALIKGVDPLPIVQHFEKRVSEEVLAVEGDAVTKLKVTFHEMAVRREFGVQKKAPVSPLMGKTFIVSWENAKLVLADAAGKPLKKTDKADKELEREYGEQIGRPNRLGKFLASKTFKKGEKVELTIDELGKIFNTEGMTSESLSLTLVDHKGDLATFALEGVLHSTEGKVNFTFTLKGTLMVDITRGRPLEMQMNADLTGSGTAEVTGKMTGTGKRTYQ